MKFELARLPTPWFHALVVLLTALVARAEEPSLSGRWSAQAMRVAWSMGDWGPACGPRPSDAGAPAGTVTITQSGSELTIQDLSRTYATSQCWEQFPGLRVTSHGGGTRGWRTVCKTAPGDSRQATVTTTLTANEKDIVFDEVGQYQFVVGQQNCTASVRRSRLFRRLVAQAPQTTGVKEAAREARATEVPASARAPRPVLEKPLALPPAGCGEPGPPARLEVRPSRKLMRPGEEFQFRSRVVDHQGCPLTVRAAWAVVGQNPAIKLIAPGKVRVADSASEGEFWLTATVEGQSTRLVVEVASPARYESLLLAGRFDPAGETRESSVIVIASGSIGSRTSQAEDGADKKRRVFISVTGGLLLIAGATIAIALFVRRRARPPPERARGSSPPVPTRPSGQGTVCPTCRQEYPSGRIFCPADGNRLALLEGPVDPRAATGGICPVCGQGFDPGVFVCPEHGEELLPMALHQARPQAKIPSGRKICPICGLQYPGDAQFCGADGAHLVVVN